MLKKNPNFCPKIGKFAMYEFSSPFVSKCTSFIQPPPQRIIEDYLPVGAK